MKLLILIIPENNRGVATLKERGESCFKLFLSKIKDFNRNNDERCRRL